MKRRRGALAVLAAVAALLALAGCGTAAARHRLGRQRRPRSPTHEVDDVADAQCAAAEQAAKQPEAAAATAPRGSRQQSLVPADGHRAQPAVRRGGLEGVEARPRALLREFEPARSSRAAGEARDACRGPSPTGPRAAPCSSRPAARPTGQEPSRADIEQLLDAGLQERETWLKNADIDTDPRYGPTGTAGPVAATLGVRGRSRLREGRRARHEADPEWVERAAGQPEVRLTVAGHRRPDVGLEPSVPADRARRDHGAAARRVRLEGRADPPHARQAPRSRRPTRPSRRSRPRPGGPRPSARGARRRAAAGLPACRDRRRGRRVRHRGRRRGAGGEDDPPQPARLRRRRRRPTRRGSTRPGRR